VHAAGRYHGRVTSPPDRSHRDGNASADAPEGSTGRAVAYGLASGAFVALVLVGAAAFLAFSAGLIVIAYFMGRVVGSLVKVGAGTSISSTVRQSIAMLVSVFWIAVAQVLVWLVAQSEGGILSIGDYLYQTFGPLVPLEFLIATFAAWWSAR
jgi:hypothetical protein